MKDSKPRVKVEQEAEKGLGYLSTDTDTPKKRLRGLAIEFAVENRDEFVEFIEQEA